MSVSEKIKQAFVEGTCIVYGKRRHWCYDGPDYTRTRCEGIIELYEEKTIPAIQEKVLKILEEQQEKIRELWKQSVVLKGGAFLAINKKKFELLFGLDIKKEKTK